MASCKILISHDKNTQTCKQNQNEETEDIVYSESVEPIHSVDVHSLLADSTADISALEKTGKVEGESNLVKVAESLLQLGHDDQKKFCIPCNGVISGNVCSHHANPIYIIPQTKAVKSLPSSMTVKESSIPGAGLGVFAVEMVEVDSMFGPMEGVKMSHEEYNKRNDNSYVWEVHHEDKACISHYLDCLDEEQSDWMRFINCARYEEEQNLIAEQYQHGIFFKVYKKLLPGQELLVWYGQPNILGITQTDTPIESFMKVVDVEKHAGSLEVSNSGKAREDVTSPKSSNECLNCKATFSSSCLLETHRNHGCPIAVNYRCTSCPASFSNMETWKNHQPQCLLRANDKKFKCVLCSRGFVEKGNLKAHLKSHLKIKDFPCQQCSAKFSRSTFLRSLVLAVHKKERPHICTTCGKSFGRHDSLTRHAKLHEDDKNEICRTCGMAYHTTSNLYSHIRKIHPVSKLMTRETCDICNRTYEDIVAHKSFVHSIKFKTQCHICDKRFFYIKQHLRSHEREGKVEKCPICFQYYKSLNGHMKIHPMETKVYKKFAVQEDNRVGIQSVACNQIVETTTDGDTIVDLMTEFITHPNITQEVTAVQPEYATDRTTTMNQQNVTKNSTENNNAVVSLQNHVENSNLVNIDFIKSIEDDVSLNSTVT